MTTHPDPDVAALKSEYQQLLHALQTGVKTELEFDPSPGTPKHLRTGVNSAIVQASGLALLLIDKGIITEHEYWRFQVDAFRREVTAYEERLSRILGARIQLH